MQRRRVVANVVSYSAVISTFEKGVHAQRALELFDTLLLQGVMPDVIIYGALISACEKGN